MSIGQQQMVKISHTKAGYSCPNPQSQQDDKHINPSHARDQDHDLQVQITSIRHFQFFKMRKTKKNKSKIHNSFEQKVHAQDSLRSAQNTKAQLPMIGFEQIQENLVTSTNFMEEEPEQSLQKMKLFDLSARIQSIKISSKERKQQNLENQPKLIQKQLIVKQTDNREEKKVQLSKRSSQRKMDDSNLFFFNKKCDICCSEFDQKAFCILECNHQYCQACLLEWAIQSLKSFKILKCPHNRCNEPIDLLTAEFLEKLPQNYKRMLKRYKIYMSILGNENLLTCPSENCDEGVINVENRKKQKQKNRKTRTVFNQQERLHCNKCKSYICQTCFQIDHPGEKCKDFTLKFEQIKQNGGFCQCSNCSKFIEKTQGCNHMTCRCGYQFCFLCNERWRLFHLCNPFNYAEFNKQANNQLTEPKCCDYFEYISAYVGKCIWAFFAITYIYPFIIVGYILSIIIFFVGLMLMGITYGYIYVLCQMGKSNSKYWSLQFLLYIVIFPIGMIKGIINTVQVKWNILKRLTKAFIRCTDMASPFNWIPFQYL